MSRPGPLFATALCLVAMPAAAHSPVQGIEGVYTGLLHPLTTPDQILALLATGLLLGNFPLSRLAPAFAAFGAGLLGGLALGDATASPAPWLYAVAAVTAGAAALAPGRWLGAVIGAAVTAGLLLGWASVPDPGPAQARLLTMTGSFIGAFLLTLYLAGSLDLIRERADHPAFGIALRVAASWIAAIALLMFAVAMGVSEG